MDFVLVLAPALAMNTTLAPPGGVCSGSGQWRQPSRRCKFRGVAVQCEVERIAAEVGVGDDIKQHAMPICYSMAERRLARGRDIGVVAASSIYAACRECRAPVTLKELAIAGHSTPRELGRVYVRIIDRMGIKPPTPEGRSYIDKVATRIHASEEVTRFSQELEEKAIDAGLGGRNPMSLAAAALYTASLDRGEPATQSDLAEAAGVSVISLRQTAKWMRSLLQAR
jgi:transcription initiation factor TFIIB